MPCSFSVTAVAANPNVELNGKFKIISGSSLLINSDLEQDGEYEYEDKDKKIRKKVGNKVLDVIVKEVKTGRNEFQFAFDKFNIWISGNSRYTK